MYRYSLLALLLTCIFSCTSIKKEILLTDVNFYNGKIYLATFSQDTRIEINKIEYIFKKKSPVYFGVLGNISTAYLAYDQEIMINKTKFPLKAIMTNGIGNYNIAFHENGMPRLFWMSKNTTIPVGNKKYVFRGVQVYTSLVLDGSAQNKSIADPLENIELYDDGAIHSGYIGEDIYVKMNMKIPEGTKVIFTREGRIDKYYDYEQNDFIIIQESLE